MNKSIKNKLAQTFATLIITAALSGCQTGKTPHPFTTMFDRRAPEYGLSHANERVEIPETMSFHEAQAASANAADVH